MKCGCAACFSFSVTSAHLATNSWGVIPVTSLCSDLAAEDSTPPRPRLLCALLSLYRFGPGLCPFRLSFATLDRLGRFCVLVRLHVPLVVLLLVAYSWPALHSLILSRNFFVYGPVSGTLRFRGFECSDGAGLLDISLGKLCDDGVRPTA